MIDINTIVQQALAQAIGQIVETQLTALNQRIAALETQLSTATLTPLTHEYIAKVAREAVATTTGITEDRIKEIADEVARDVMSEHHDEFDHNSYDNVVNKLDDYDLDEFLTDDNIEEKVESAVKNMTFTVSVE